MRLSVLSSGSSGNATFIESEDFGFLVDAGFSRRRIAALLGKVGRSLDDVGAVLLTHGHSDHTSGARSLVRDCGVPVYAVSGVWDRRGVNTVEAGETFAPGGISATFFEVPHDSATFGLRLSDGEHEAALATDLGEATPEVARWLRGAEAVVLEANHDLEWLRRGSYPADLKRRISSPRGHLSNAQAAEMARSLAPHGLKDLVLAHLSEKNNSAIQACGTVSRVLREAGFGGVRVRASRAGHPTPWVEVGATVEAVEQTYRYERVAEAGRLFEVE